MAWVMPEWMEVINYDPAISKWNKDPNPEDYLICTDVLEHVEPQLIDNVIEHLVSKFNKSAFLAIDLERSKNILPSGKNAHLIVKDASYWVNKMMGNHTIVATKQKNNRVLYLELTKEER
jgi:hypothetical protein